MINWHEKWVQVIRGRLRTHFNILVFLLIVGLSAVLCFCGLGRRTLWQDEGETAVLSRRVLIDGVPGVLSRYNLVEQGLSQYDRKYRWTYHPWGQFYLAAASFAVFGQTNFAARLPFALCGVFTVALLYIFVWRHWHSLAVAALSSLLLATSTAFVLHCRQCRYYSLSALTCLAVVVVFVELMKRPCRGWWIVFGVALAAQFYADFGTLTVILPGLAVSLWPMGSRRQEITAAAKSFALAALLILPGLLLHWNRLTMAGGGNHIFLPVLWVHIYFLDNWFVPLVFLVPAAAVFVLQRAKSNWQLSEQDRIIITCVLIMGSTVVGMAWASPHPSIRYLVPSISLAKLMLAVILIKGYILLREKGLPLLSARIVIVVGILILIFSNGFSLATQYLAGENRENYEVLDFCTKSKPAVRTEFTGLLYEITHDFVCPDRVAVNVADDLAEAGEAVMIDYGNFVLRFYRPDLQIYDPTEFPNFQRLPDLCIECQAPWRIDMKGSQKDFISRIIYVPIASPGGNIPEPDEHWFATNSVRRPFWIYLRRDHEDRMSRLPQAAEELDARWFRRR
jgi:hypothetical protein